MITKRQARSIIRKAIKRVPEGEEIRHLNIMPMMDMMTILLVAMIFQAANAAAMSIGDVNLPDSVSFDPPPESAVMLTIAPSAIIVDGEPIPGLRVQNGDVDASEKKGGALGIQIPRLTRFLGNLRKSNDQQMIADGKQPDAVPELLIIGDKTIPYKLLFQVIVSARADDAGYRRFRLIVLEDARAEP